MFEMNYNKIMPGKFPATLTELARFHNLPDLEITPVNRPMAKGLNGEHYHQVVRHTSSRPDKSKESREQVDIQKLMIRLPVLCEHFNLHRKIGEGTYSTVYLATFKNMVGKKKFAVKHLTQNFSLSRIQKELKFMQMIGGQDNVVSVINCLKSENEDCVVFVMPYLEHKRFSDYVLTMDVGELRVYMKNLFIALRRVHAFNVIHRDVKPGNFLYNREHNEFLLVDFGLAQLIEESPKTKRSSGHTDDENKPIDYSKRKRSGSNDENPGTKVTLLSPLKSRENIIANTTDKTGRSVDLTPPIQNSDRKPERTPLKSKSHTSSSLSSSSRKKLFYDESAISNTTPNARKVFPLTPNPLKSNAENKFTSPNDRIRTKDHRSFTPLVARRSMSGSFVQVRNSQVVAHKSACACSGEGTICSSCRGKRAMAAPRAGTPGFRPPEVLLKYLNQTTAVDMWAAGVVMLCVLSGCYPFFKSPTDMAALTEIMTLFGTDQLADVAAKFGRRVTSSSSKKPVDLRKMCRRLRTRRMAGSSYRPTKGFGKCEECLQTILESGCVCPTGDVGCDNSLSDGDVFPDSAYHLLLRLLDLDPATRITADEALSHPFITGQQSS